MEHSRFSPSNEIAFACPGSVYRQQHVEDRNRYLTHKYTEMAAIPNRDKVLHALGDDTKKQAAYGTLLHEIRDEAITKEVSVHDLFNRHGLDDDFTLSRLEGQVEYIREQFSLSSRCGVEDKVVNFGTGSGGRMDAWWLIADTIFGDDLKTGRIKVSAYEKYQLMRYMCATLDMLGWPKEVTKVVMSISGINFADSRFTITVAELWQWRNTKLRAFFDDAYSLRPTISSGEHCKYCMSNGVNCPESGSVIDLYTGRIPTDTAILTTAALEELAVKASTVKTSSEKVLAELELRYHMDGSDPKRLFWKDGRAKTSYINNDPEETLAHLVVDPATLLYKPPAFITMAAMRKLFEGNTPALDFLKSGYDRKNVDVQQFIEVYDDLKALLKPKSFRTLRQLQEVFRHAPKALDILEGDIDFNTLESKLLPFISAGLFEYQALVSASFLKKLLTEEAASKVVHTTHYASKLTVKT